MPLRDSMSTEELLAVGFEISPTNPSVAGHKKHSAWRYKCEVCGKWNRERAGNECPACRQTENLRDKAPEAPAKPKKPVAKKSKET